MRNPWPVGTLLRGLAIAGMAFLPFAALSCSRSGEYPQPPCAIAVRAGEPLQEALDRAPSGAVVCLGTGTWEENVRVMKPITLRGAGSKRTILRSAGLAEPVIAVGPLDEPGEVIISGITGTGAAGSCADPTGCAHGLLIGGNAYVSVHDCTFLENAADGIQVRGAAHVALDGVKSVGNGSYGLRVREGGEVTATDSSLTRNRTGGVWLSDTARLDLVRSEVTKNDRMGLWIRDEATVTGEGSRVSDNGSHGIWIQGQARVSLFESTISTNADTGLFLEGGGQATLIACRIERAWDGIHARGTTQLRVEEGTIADIRWDGIRIGGSARAELVGCTIHGGGGSGICATDSAEVEVRNSRIESWPIGILSLAVLSLRGGGNVLTGNGVDLVGNLPGTVRAPRRIPSVSEARFPDPQYRNLQEAIDALLPEGRLVVEGGVHIGGITIDKPVRIQGDGIVLLTGAAGDKAPVVSLVGGADAELVGIAVGYGGEGVILGADAQGTFIDCVISDNLEGVRLSDRAHASLVRCRLSRNDHGGMWLWGGAQAQIEDGVFTANGTAEGGTAGPGVGVAERAHLVIVGSVVTESGWAGGILLRDSAQAELWGNTIHRNMGPGVVLFDAACTGFSWYRFTGRVQGGDNLISDNGKGNLCPGELGFLATEGGEFDWRR